MIITYPIKIVSFALDQVKQNSKMAIVFDLIQLFFCCAYLFRAIYVKMLEKGINRKKDKDGKDIEPEGYSRSCSLFTDFLVIFSFSAKFYFSL